MKTENRLVSRMRVQPFNLDLEISTVLIAIGILPCRKGHRLIRDAVVSGLSRYPAANNGRAVYGIVSALHSCTPKACESGIRNAVRGAHRSGSLLRLNELLGNHVISSAYPPPNLEFISLLMQYFYYKFAGLF